ncbi:S8 family peptidase [Sulfurimonas sp. HSL1-2]|uniref:S8 family peptidase n=1 Tax=Thiomicrolovo zhangzhouensis TaxID=3131933 RepID=UPI0031F90411
MQQNIFHRLATGSGMMMLGLILLFSGCGTSTSSGTATDDPVTPSDPTAKNSVALGPISGATITVWDVAGQNLYQTKTTTFNAATELMDDNHTLVPYAEQTVGKFAVTSLGGLASTRLVLVKSEGGVDIDPDDDGQYVKVEIKPVQGSLYAYVTVADLLNNNVRVNAFTTIAAEWIRQEKLTDETEIKSVLAKLSERLFKVSGTALSAFNPAKLSTGGVMEDLTLLSDAQSYADAAASATIQELYTGTVHLFHDTDNDALFDDFELLVGTNPAAANSDGDALGDYGEFFAGTDPTVSDTVDHIDALYDYQWHLENTGQDAGSIYGGSGIPGNDINVVPVWESYAGRRSIFVGVVDTGVQAVHPDLAANLDLSKSYRYSDGASDPSPDADQLTSDPYGSSHGTACAGLIAASGWNDIGVRGVAPFVKVAGYNVFSLPTDANFADALNKAIDISSNSWGYGSEFLVPDPTLVASVQTATETGRDGKGTVIVFAAGNDRNYNGYKDENNNTLHIGNANNSEILNNPYVLTITAINADGQYSSYANYGANILVSAPGGEYGVNEPAIVTTDYTGLTYGLDSTGFANSYRGGYRFDVPGNENGDYTNYMNGTSAATPIVSGIAALMLTANPALTYRDVGYILATTAKKIDPSDGDWTTNGAGYPINHNYGFGLVDADKAVAEAENFTSLGAETVLPKQTASPNQSISEGTTGVTSSITVTPPQPVKVEHVDVWVTISHARPGDLDIVLVSPQGTQSHLAYGGQYYLEGSYSDWRFSTVRCLDENASGTWTLNVKDLRSGTTGTLNSWSLQIRGH